MSPTPPTTIAPVRRSFHAVVRAVVPSARNLDDEGWSRLEEIVDEALAERSVGERRQFVVFLRLLSFFSLLRFGRTLGRLSGEKATALLRSLERGRSLMLRRGVWGVRTLAFMGYYGQPAVQDALGYRAAAGGWSLRRNADA